MLNSSESLTASLSLAKKDNASHNFCLPLSLSIFFLRGAQNFFSRFHQRTARSSRACHGKRMRGGGGTHGPERVNGDFAFRKNRSIVSGMRVPRCLTPASINHHRRNWQDPFLFRGLSRQPLLLFLVCVWIVLHKIYPILQHRGAAMRTLTE